jgi:hypothetical protein
MADFRVFLSAVSSEFGAARDTVANDLQSHGEEIIARVQRSFRQDGQPGTLLHKLRRYIEECNAVICLMGSRSGAGFPAMAEAQAFREDLPPGISEASYTQWEFFFATRLRKACFVYVATSRFPADTDDPAEEDRPDLQAAFIAHVKASGRQRTEVGSRHEFRAEALKDLPRQRCPLVWSGSCGD